MKKSVLGKYQNKYFNLKFSFEKKIFLSKTIVLYMKSHFDLIRMTVIAFSLGLRAFKDHMFIIIICS